MAGRRDQKSVIKSGFDASTMVYVSMAVILLVLTLSMYTFGIDFGFVSIAGSQNVNVLYIGAAICLFIAYIADVMYIKAIRKYYRKDATLLTYVPYFNFISIMGKNMSMASYGLVAVIAIAVLPTYTPLGRFMPVDFLMFMAPNAVIVILVSMAIFTFMRGFHTYSLKKRIETKYREEISESYGSGGNLTMVSNAIYFLPIIRSVSIFTDLNFINTVRIELNEMRKGEE